MFSALSESSLADINLEVDCGDCEIDLRIFHRRNNFAAIASLLSHSV